MWRSVCRSFLLAMCCAIVAPHRAFPQTVQEPNGPQRRASFAFDHVLSIYEWRGAFDFAPNRDRQPTLSPSFDIHLHGNSRFLPLDSLATTEASGWITAIQPLASYDLQTWSLAPYVTLAGNSYVTSPRPGKIVASLITRQASGFGATGLRLTSPDQSLLSAGIGLARQTQSAFASTDASGIVPVTASGLMLASEDSLSVQPIAEGAFVTASARLDERMFAQRDERYSNDSIRMALVSGVGDPNAAQNSALLQLGLLRRDFFFSPDSLTSLKQERTQYSVLLTDSLTYPIAQDFWRTHLAFEIEPRKITRASDANSASFISSTFSTFSTLMAPSNVSSLRLLAQASINAGEEDSLLTRWSGNALMRYEERSETISLTQDQLPGVETAILHKLEETLNEASYSARTTTLDAIIRYTPSTKDQTELQGATRLLSYDTPSELNHDNHDDLVSSFTVRHRHDFSSGVNWSLSLRGSREHLVYLKSDRSAQNAVTQSIVFGSIATFATSSISVMTGGEVFANYTVFDYVNQLPQLSAIGNYVLRGMTLTDTLAFPLVSLSHSGPQISLEQAMALRVSERGSYNDSAYTERRETRIAEAGASIYVTVSSQHGMEIPWTVRIGARTFVTSHSGRFAQNAQAAPFEELERQTRIGPAIAIEMGRLYSHGPSLQASMWYAWSSSKLFESALATKPIAQPESYLTAAWSF